MTDDIKDMTFIFRKVFDDPGCPDNGTLVHIYYKFNQKNNTLLVEDYSIHFIMDGETGKNVADDQSQIDDDLYRYLFKKAYYELVDTIILKK